ncbi:MAG TPA: tyrosine--tRNA ligase [Candidatus Saccharimonadales bacterium]
MTLSEELTWRGFINQTSYKDITAVDNGVVSFYFGVDPSSDSMTIGNLASAMMVRQFISHGHKAYLLVGGATGMIGDPDGKSEERQLQSLEQIDNNKKAIAAQYNQVFSGQDFTLVDNYDWFKDMNYLDFLRDIGKHVPTRQMLGRDFIQSRLGENSSGISYAEFSYSLIQGYDFLYLHQNMGVDLQLCGADQWGNSVTGVDLIRRITGDEVNVWSSPLIVNKATGVKFGKTEDGAIWLDPNKTSPTAFYQFWVNCDDQGLEDYLKVYTLLTKDEIDSLVSEHSSNPGARTGQKRLAEEVTKLIHGDQNAELAKQVTGYLTQEYSIDQAEQNIIEALRQEIPSLRTTADGSILDALVEAGLASSKGEARKLIAGRGISANGKLVERDNFEQTDFNQGRLILRRGKAFKDSALVELS